MNNNLREVVTVEESKSKSKHKEKYDNYISGPGWEAKKKQFYRHMPKTCLACGSNKLIHLHHHTYDRLFAEKLTDLVPLCESCHSEVHRLHDLETQRSLTYVTFLYISTTAGLSKPLTPSSYNPRKQKGSTQPKRSKPKSTPSKENSAPKQKEPAAINTHPAVSAKKIKVCVYCKKDGIYSHRTSVNSKKKLYRLQRHGTYLHGHCRDKMLRDGS